MECQVTLPVIRQLLTRMNTEQVTQAETRMNQLSNRRVQFLPIIFAIMSDPVEEQWVKTMAASFLNELFTRTLSDQNYNVIYKTLIEILSSGMIKEIDKKIFGKLITKWLQFTSEEQRQNWISFIEQCMRNSSFYGTALIVINSICVADISLKLLQRVITCTYQNLLKVEVKLENVGLITEIIKTWIVVVEQLHSEKKMRKFLQTMMCSQLQINLIKSVYQLQAEENTIVCLKQNFSGLDSIKIEAAELHKKMLDIQIQRADNALMLVLVLTEYFLPAFANTLKILAARREVVSQQSCEELQITLLSIVRLYITIKPEEVNLQQVVFFQDQVIFPLLRAQVAQLQKFQESPQDFLLLAQDCFDNQKSGILKTQAAKLLQTLADQIERSLDYCIMRALESIQVKFGYLQLKNASNPQILQLQTAIVVLSIFSFKLTSYPAQIQLLHRVLSDKRARLVSELELARIFTFLAYNYFQIFREPTQGEEWINYALYYQRHPTTRYCAFDFISSVLDGYFNEEFLEVIGQQIQNGNENMIWEILGKVVSQHFDTLTNQGFTFLAFKLFARIQKQFQILNISQKNNSLDIINCLRALAHIFKTLKTSTKDIEQKNIIIVTVCTIFDYYSKAVQLGIDSEIIKIAVELIDAVDCVTPQIQHYTTHFITIFRGHLKYCNKNYLRYFNQILMKIDVNTNYSILLQIMLALRDSLIAILNKLRKDGQDRLKPYPHFRISLSSILIVLQNCIALFGTHLVTPGNVEYLQQINQICTDLLPKTKQSMQKTSTALIIFARTLNILFLCHMHLKDELIYNHLKNFQAQNLYHGYDTKVLMACISTQIFNESDLNGVVFLLVVVKHIIEGSDYKDQFLAKGRKNKSNQIKYLNKVKKLEQCDKFIETIDSPFKTEKSPTLMLNQLFLKMKTINEDMYNSVLQALPAEVLSFFNKYLDFESIQKKKRSYKKVIGIKMEGEPTNPSAEKEDFNDLEPDSNLKRERVKIKKEGKGIKKIKQQKKKRQGQYE